jgi:hypothetical protein
LNITFIVSGRSYARGPFLHSLYHFEAIVPILCWADVRE